MLLETRKQLLQMIGIPVSVVSTAAEYYAAVCAASPSIILLCQSLSTEECMDAAAFAEAKSPASKVLLMCTMPGECLLAQRHDEFFSGDGPAALIQRVKQLLSGSQWKPASAARTQQH